LHEGLSHDLIIIFVAILMNNLIYVKQGLHAAMLIIQTFSLHS